MALVCGTRFVPAPENVINSRVSRVLGSALISPAISSRTRPCFIGSHLMKWRNCCPARDSRLRPGVGEELTGRREGRDISTIRYQLTVESSGAEIQRNPESGSARNGSASGSDSLSPSGKGIAWHDTHSQEESGKD